MFLRKTERRKNGKTHLYWSVVENRRLDNGRVIQRHALYLGEINSSQAEAWRRAIEVFDEDAGRTRALALFPEDRCEAPEGDDVIRLRLSEMRLCRPRQFGACWLAGVLWRELKLDRFWAERLPKSRKGTHWHYVLQVLVCYRLISPGSEWRLHRQWFLDSAMADLLGADFGLAEAHKLYDCHDLLIAHKQELFSHLTERWRDLFNASFDVLLYDLTSTYFEVNASDLPEDSKRRHGYSRDKRPDCPQLVIALVVTPEGLPLAYEVLPGNTADCKTLRAFLAKIEQQYGKARRVWVMLCAVFSYVNWAAHGAGISGSSAQSTPHYRPRSQPSSSVPSCRRRPPSGGARTSGNTCRSAWRFKSISARAYRMVVFRLACPSH